MDYIYDIVLNYQNNYYEFYEWKTTDKIINIKKIPVYKVNNENYLNLKYNEVILDRKIIPKQIKMFLIGFGLMTIGFVYIILYLNIISIGYNFSYYVNFISRRIECYFSIIGFIILNLSIYIKGDKKYGLYL